MRQTMNFLITEDELYLLEAELQKNPEVKKYSEEYKDIKTSTMDKSFKSVIPQLKKTKIVHDKKVISVYNKAEAEIGKDKIERIREILNENIKQSNITSSDSVKSVSEKSAVSFRKAWEEIGKESWMDNAISILKIAAISISLQLVLVLSLFNPVLSMAFGILFVPLFFLLAFYIVSKNVFRFFRAVSYFSIIVGVVIVAAGLATLPFSGTGAMIALYGAAFTFTGILSLISIVLLKYAQLSIKEEKKEKRIGIGFFITFIYSLLHISTPLTVFVHGFKRTMM